MSDAVAKLRFDLLANVTSFKSGLREGSAALGDFQSQTERFSKTFNAQKAVSARIDAEKASWKSSMMEVRKDVMAMADPADSKTAGLRMNSLAQMNARRDPALDRSMRLRDQIPWGQSMRTEMSREAVLSAAAIGKHSKELKTSIGAAIRDIGRESAGAVGLGGMFGKAAGVMGAHPVAAAGAVAALGAGVAIAHVRERDAYVRNVGRQSQISGASSTDTSMLMSAGIESETMSKFSRSIAERDAAFSRLKLDPEKLGMRPMRESMLAVADAMNRVSNPADRAKIAFDLFGKSGSEMIPVLSSLRKNLTAMGEAVVVRPEEIAKVKAWDSALRDLGGTVDAVSLKLGKMMGAESGLLTEGTRGLSIGVKLLSGDMGGAIKDSLRYHRQDYEVANADKLEAARTKTQAMAAEAKKYADAMKDAARAANEIVSPARQSLLGADFIQDEDYRRKAEAGGMKPDEIAANLRLFAKRRDDAKAGSRASQLRDQSQELDPTERLDQAMADAALWRDYNKHRSDGERIYQDMRHQAMVNYYVEAKGLSQKQLQQEADGERSITERYKDRIEWLRGMVDQKVLDPTLAANREAAAGRDLRKQLGIERPDEEFSARVRDLKGARDAGQITRDEYDTSLRDTEKSAVERELAKVQTVSPVAAMQAGSREAYAMLVQAQLSDPKVELAKKTLERLKMLEKIEENTRRPAGNVDEIFNGQR